MPTSSGGANADKNRSWRLEPHKEVNSVAHFCPRAPTTEIGLLPRFPDTPRFYWDTSKPIDSDPRPRMEKLAQMGGSLKTRASPGGRVGVPLRGKRKEESQLLRLPLRSQLESSTSSSSSVMKSCLDFLDFPGPGEYSVYSQFPAPRRFGKGQDHQKSALLDRSRDSADWT